MNVNGEDLAKVKVGGIRWLKKSAMRKYIKDPVVFSEFMIRSTSYETYSAYVIEPSYGLHKAMGILIIIIVSWRQMFQNKFKICRNFYKNKKT